MQFIHLCVVTVLDLLVERTPLTTNKQGAMGAFDGPPRAGIG